MSALRYAAGMNETQENMEALPCNPINLLSGNSLLQIHLNTNRSLPKDGSKDFSPSNSWMEKKQIQRALDERKELLEEERVEKWGFLAAASWDSKKKLAEVTKRTGKHFQTLGFEKGGTLYLYPEEALYLLETNCLELTFGGVPMSVQQAYTMLIGSGTGCNLDEYRTYSYLARQGYKLLRFTSQAGHTKYEKAIRLDQHAPIKRDHPGRTSHKSSNSKKSFAKDSAVESVPMVKIVKQESSGNQILKGDVVCGSTNSTANQETSAPVVLNDEHHIKTETSDSRILDPVVTEDSRPATNGVSGESTLESLPPGQDSTRLSPEPSPSIDDDAQLTQVDSKGLDAQHLEGEPTDETNEIIYTESVEAESKSEVSQNMDNTSRSIPEELKTSNSSAIVDSSLPSSSEGSVLANIADGKLPLSSKECLSANVSDALPSSSKGAATKAYDIAESLLSLGSALIEKGNSSEVFGDRKRSTDKDITHTLQSEIIKVLGAHFDSVASEEALNAVASRAAQTILSHISIDNEKSADFTLEKSSPVTGLGADQEDCVSDGNHRVGKDSSAQLNVSHGAVLRKETAFPSEAKFENIITVETAVVKIRDDGTECQSSKKSSTFLSLQSNQTPETDECCEVEASHSRIMKRPASCDKETDDCTAVLIKKSKKNDVCDSEIEILDFVPEKKEVELVDLSDESSSDTMKGVITDVRDVENNSIEVINVPDSSTDESVETSSSSDSSNDSSTSASGSSVILEESKHSNWETERKRILDSFPNMYRMQEISLNPPSQDLLPTNVQPQHRQYVINRWRLQKDGKPPSYSAPRSQFPFQNDSPLTPSCNFLPQAGHPINPWQQNMPINPLVAVQAIAQLVLPMLGLPPTSFQPEQMWRPNNSWFPPHPAWGAGPRFKHHAPRGNNWNRSRSRPYGYRHHNPRFQRRGSNNHFSPKSSNHRRPAQVIELPNEVAPFQPYLNAQREDSYVTESRKHHGNPSKWHIWMQKNGQGHRGKKNKRLQEKIWLSKRYFNPPEKYKHFLVEEPSPCRSLEPDGSHSSNENSNLKTELDSESGSSEEDSDDDHLDNQDSKSIVQSSSAEASDDTRSSINSPSDVKPLLSPRNCTSFGAVFKSLQVIKEADTESMVSTVCAGSLKPQFDIFLPSKPFKKGNLPVPDYHLCIKGYGEDVPSPGAVKALQECLNDSVPIMFAIVSPDDISFIQLCEVSIPSVNS